MLEAPKTQKATVAAIRAMELSCSVRDGEYRVAFKDGSPASREASAYYTNDREDAFYTAVKMVENSY
jgi:hypothetical protein